MLGTTGYHCLVLIKTNFILVAQLCFLCFLLATSTITRTSQSLWLFSEQISVCGMQLNPLVISTLHLNVIAFHCRCKCCQTRTVPRSRHSRRTTDTPPRYQSRAECLLITNYSLIFTTKINNSRSALWAPDNSQCRKSLQYQR